MHCSKIEKIEISKNSKKLKSSGANMKSCFEKNLAFTICAVIGLGFGACSDAALKDQKSQLRPSFNINNQQGFVDTYLSIKQNI